MGLTVHAVRGLGSIFCVSCVHFFCKGQVLCCVITGMCKGRPHRRHCNFSVFFN